MLKKRENVLNIQSKLLGFRQQMFGEKTKLGIKLSKVCSHVGHKERKLLGKGLAGVRAEYGTLPSFNQFGWRR